MNFSAAKIAADYAVNVLGYDGARPVHSFELASGATAVLVDVGSGKFGFVVHRDRVEQSDILESEYNRDRVRHGR